MIRIHEISIACPVCHKTSWCLVSDDGRFAACKRVSKGALTDLGALGYLHFLPNGVDTKNYTPEKREVIPYETWEQKQREFENNVSFVPHLGLRASSLRNYGIGFNRDGQYFTFPMYNEQGRICGMSTRFKDGAKACVKGSAIGVFLPRKKHNQDVWCAVEGASDAATIWELGFNAIGRYNCDTPVGTIYNIVGTKIKAKAIVVVADQNEVGINGAKKLAYKLSDKIRTVVMYMPPGIKDIREFYNKGLTREKFSYAIRQLGV